MPGQLLLRADVVAVFKEMRRERMPHHVRTDTLRDAGPPRRFRHRLLHHGLVQVIARRRHESRISGHSVHAHVVGEHGDSEVVLWSTARIAGIALRDWRGWMPERESALADEVRTAAYEIIRRKGATNHAIGLVTADLLRCLLRDERRVLTVSRVQDGVMGLRDVALSLPTIVGAQGALDVLAPETNQDERARLEHSADVLRRAAAEAGLGSLRPAS